MMDEIRIIKHVGTVSSGEGKYQKEFNIVSINGESFCYDLREWSLDHCSYRNGISLKNEEAQELLMLLKSCYQDGNEDTLKENNTTEMANSILPTQLTLEGVEGIAGKTDDQLFEFLKTNGISYIDKRSKGGALWIVRGHEIDSIMIECANMGYKFYYSEKGGRITKGKPGWYLMPKKNK